MVKQKKFLKMIGILVAVGCFSIVFSALTGLGACPIKATIGVPCPACGMTTAVILFLQGNFAESFYYHPLMIFLGLIPFLVIEGKKTSPKKQNRIAMVIAILFIGVYALRMIFLFPHMPPMSLNRDALVFNILRWVFETLALS